MPASKQVFAGQVAVVTGAGSGLGRSYAHLLARLGASLVVNDLGTSARGLGSTPTSAQAVVNEIIEAGGIAVASTESVNTPEGGRSIIETALETFGRVDAVINNAGILRSAPLDETTDEDLSAIIDVHLKGAFHVTRPAFRAMKLRGYGRILFTASSAGVFGAEGNAAYGSAKTGLIGLMHATAIEGAAYGIRSNVLMPASTTRMAAEGEASYLDRIRSAATAMPERMTAMDPDFVAPLAAYLISNDCMSTHAIYTAVLGRYARVFLGLGSGWYGPTDQPSDISTVGSHFAEIGATKPFTIPQHLAEEFEEMAAKWAVPQTAASVASTGGPTGLHDAWSSFCRELEATGLAMLESDDVSDEQTAAESIRYLTRELRVQLDERFDGADRLHPRLVRIDEAGSGPTGPNIDNWYLRATIDPTRRYLLRGDLSTVWDVNVSVHRAPDFGVVAERYKNDLGDSYFELQLVPPTETGDPSANHILLEPDADQLFVRVYYYDWATETPPWFELVCLDEAATRPPGALQPETVPDALARTAAGLRRLTTQGYPTWIMTRLREHPVNVIGPIVFTSGGQSIHYGGNLWDLGLDDALLIDCEVPVARYVSFQTYSIPWLEPIERATRITSLNGTQLRVDPDSRIRLVLSHHDPGIQNWLDTGGRRFGHLMYRWIWSENDPLPVASVVPFAEVQSYLPGDTPTFGVDERRSQLEIRRQHLARRFRQ